MKADLEKEVELRETMKVQVEKRENQLRKSVESLLGTPLCIVVAFVFSPDKSSLTVLTLTLN